MCLQGGVPVDISPYVPASATVAEVKVTMTSGIIANHPTMPQFRRDADQVNDVIAFMQSLER
jgi:hypothetical protein